MAKIELDLPSQIALAKLPPPLTEFPFHKDRKWKFDLCWPLRMLAVEIEGQNSKVNGKWVKGAGRHNRPRGFEDDCEKYNAAALAGWRVFRVTTAMVKYGRALALLEEALK